jgi:hypothetical protein
MQEVQLRLISLGVVCFCGTPLPILLRNDNPSPAFYRCFNCGSALRLSLDRELDKEKEE